MKKFRSIFLAVLMAAYWPFFYATSAYAALDSYSVVKMTTTAAGYVGNTLNVPVLVDATVGTSKSLTWGTLAMTASKGAAILGRVAMLGGIASNVYAGAQLVSYLYDKGYEYLQGELNKAVPGSTTYSMNPADPYYQSTMDAASGGSNIFMGVYPDQASAYAAASSYATYSLGCAAMNEHYGFCYSNHQGEFTQNIYIYPLVEGAVLGTQGEKIYTPVDEAEMSNLTGLIQADLENSDSTAQSLQKAILEAVKDVIENPQSSLVTGSSTAAVDAVKAAVNSAVSDTTKTNAETQASSADAATQYNISSSINNASTLTKADVVDAIKQANAAKTASDIAAVNAASVASMTAEALPAAPTKLSLTSIFTDFTNGIASLPILSFLQSSGPSVDNSACEMITLDFGYIFGMGNLGTATVGLCPYASTFQFMGNVLLAITGWRWTSYIFES